MKILFVILAIMLCAGVAVAEEIEVNTTIDRIVTKLDQNGQEYTRAIITEQRTKNGIAFERTLAIMFFGEHNAKAKTLSTGDTLHGIADSSLYKGRESYTWLGFAK
jgi:hypothetical protein